MWFARKSPLSSFFTEILIYGWLRLLSWLSWHWDSREDSPVSSCLVYSGVLSLCHDTRCTAELGQTELGVACESRYPHSTGVAVGTPLLCFGSVVLNVILSVWSET